MPTKVKIKINDIQNLRFILDGIYENKNQVQLAQWALKLAERSLEFAGYNYEIDLIIQDGFEINRKWQREAAQVNDVRVASFKIHKLAKSCSDPVIEAALRVAGHACSTGHMREHAMVASDYAIKVINLKYPGDEIVVKIEREWQVETLKLII